MSLKSTTRQLFADTFGYAATHTIQAPGRVNLIGEHTDYNDGFVLPCAIDYQTVIACARRDDRQVRVIAMDYDNQQDSFSLDAPIEPVKEPMWANYVRGVVKHLQQRDAGTGGVDMVISGNVPQGAGLRHYGSADFSTRQTGSRHAARLPHPGDPCGADAGQRRRGYYQQQFPPLAGRQ